MWGSPALIGGLSSGPYAVDRGEGLLEVEVVGVESHPICRAAGTCQYGPLFAWPP